MTDYSYYHDALAGRKQPIDADSPQPGIYYIRDGKNGPRKPVWIWIDKETGKMRAAIARAQEVDPHTIWTWVADKPCPKDAADYWMQHRKFPGEIEDPSIGDNSGDLSLADQLRDYMDTARSWFSKAKIDTQQACDMAANYAAKIIELKGKVDKERDGKVRPHLEAQREINAEYKPVIDEATDLSKQIKRATDGFLIAEKRRLEAEARAKYEAERAAAEAERKRIEEERAKKMAEDPIAALTDPEPELPEAPPPPAPVKVQAGGQRGKKLSLRKVIEYDVTDYDKVLAFVMHDAKVRAVVEQVAKQQSRAGIDVPGVTKREVEVAA